MKRNDSLLLIVVVVVVSVVLSFVLSKVLIAPPSNRQTKVEVVDKISSEFAQTDKKYFNSNSVDPTRTITIGDSSTATPFNTPKQQ